LLVANAVALRHRVLPRALGYIGVLGGIALLLVFTGALLRSPHLIDVMVGLGGLVIGPVWYFWVGFVLRKAGRSTGALENGV